MIIIPINMGKWIHCPTKNILVSSVIKIIFDKSSILQYAVNIDNFF